MHGKKAEEIVPYDEAVNEGMKILSEGRGADKTERTLPKGTVYLENDKRERKSTGSYYTPDYIVKYIVANTVGPVLDEKFRLLTPEFRAAQKRFRDAEKRAAEFRKKGMQPDDPNKFTPELRAIADRLFDVTVLDPAMGSGHFLVEAADYISDRMIDFLNGFPRNPASMMLAETRTAILAAMEKDGIAIDREKLTDVNLLKRHVLKRCIYGVDLNPMAVELAKVSLWLNCFTLGAPLSFVDHHLKCGNSLIGANVEEVRGRIESSGQLTLGSTEFTGLMLAVDLMRHVGELEDVTPAQIAESKREYRRAADSLAPFKRVLDIYTSQYFGNEPRVVKPKKGPKYTVEPAIEFLSSAESQRWIKQKETRGLTNRSEEVVTRAVDAASTHRFFHWELEFPEVFYAKGVKKENPGFDAVVGNPPYLNIKEQNAGETEFFKEQYKSIVGRADTSVMFVSHMVLQLAIYGNMGVIISNKFIHSQYGKPFLSNLVEKARIKELVDFGDSPVFDDPTVYTCILSLEKGIDGAPSGDCHRTIKARTSDLISLALYNGVVTEGHNDLSNGLTTAYSRRPCNSLRHFTTAIREGSANGQDTVFAFQHDLLEKLALEQEIVRPFILPESVDRYLFSESRWLVIWPYLEKTLVDLSLYPEVRNYLVNHRALLEKRYCVKKGGKAFYAFHDPAFPSRQDGHKIVTGDIALYPSFCLVDASIDVVFKNTCYVIVPHLSIDPHFLLAVLNSRLTFDFLSTISPKVRGGYLRYKTKYLELIPVPQAHFTTPEKERTALAKEATALYDQALKGSNFALLLEFIESLLPKNKQGEFLAFADGATGAEEKSDVVHDLLAHLAEEMIRLNREKRLEMKRWLGWLEGKVKMREGIDSLSGKTTLQSYPGDYQKGEEAATFEDVWKVLLKNKGKLGAPLTHPGLEAELRREYEASLAKLLPLKERLAATDRIIDQVVYRLYGLNEEEIAIVEGR